MCFRYHRYVIHDSLFRVWLDILFADVRYFNGLIIPDDTRPSMARKNFIPSLSTQRYTYSSVSLQQM